jgi:hypothetical protein
MSYIFRDSNKTTMIRIPSPLVGEGRVRGSKVITLPYPLPSREGNRF